MSNAGLTLPDEVPPTSAKSKTNILHGPHGIRAGWRALTFLAILATLVFLLSSTLRLLSHGRITFGYNHGLTPVSVALTDGIIFLCQSVAAIIMGRIERRNFGQYGLPRVTAFRQHFWTGAVAGFLAISSSLSCIFMLHGYRITALAIHSSTIVSAAVAWGVAFVILGLAEEFGFRGYLQFTLTAGIGFWPSAVLLSVWFAVIHIGPNETKFGVFSVLLFAFLFCLFLRRTGTLWWAVGFHAGWDWGQTFFYGVPDSGFAPYHSLFTSAFGGPHWLTGGSAGPEASIFTPVVLLVTAILFSRFCSANRYGMSQL